MGEDRLLWARLAKYREIVGHKSLNHIVANSDKYEGLESLDKTTRDDFVTACDLRYMYFSGITSGKFFDNNHPDFDPSCSGSIYEARGRGIKMEYLSNTKDKFVVHPGNIGCGEFGWTPNGESWGDGGYDSGFSTNTTDEVKENYHSRMEQLAKVFVSLGFIVYGFDCYISGEGYLSPLTYKLLTEEDCTLESTGEKFYILMIYFS